MPSWVPDATFYEIVPDRLAGDRPDRLAPLALDELAPRAAAAFEPWGAGLPGDWTMASGQTAGGGPAPIGRNGGRSSRAMCWSG